ncbi:hypothetical protein KAR91_14330 [Candidatus Pacearchaeota archaeon]|nr:hypothetical protein [Candidatus Pacearchaeota archaeon]
MKQIVDFEQARQLFIAKINIKTELVIVVGAREIAQPTIGELIEWIDENIKKEKPYNWCIGRYNTDWQLIQPFKLTRGVELIDALVDLCIKIKEQK